MEENTMEDLSGVETEDILTPGVYNTIPGVGETPIKNPGVDNLDVDVKIEIPPEYTGTVKYTGVEICKIPGVTTDTNATDLPSTKLLTEEGEIPHLSALTPPTQAIYGMECLRKNQKRDYSYRFFAVMYHTSTHVSFDRVQASLRNKSSE